MKAESSLMEVSTDTNPFSQESKDSTEITSEFFRGLGQSFEIGTVSDSDLLLAQFLDANELNNKNDRSTTTVVNSKIGKEDKNHSVFLQSLQSSKKAFKVIQKWEGAVIEVGEDSFTAELTPIKGEDGEFVAEIFIEEVDEEDLELLKSGALFYWTIGFQKDPYTMRVSLIRFRRIPPITKGQLLRAKVQAGRLGDLLNAG